MAMLRCVARTAHLCKCPERVAHTSRSVANGPASCFSSTTVPLNHNGVPHPCAFFAQGWDSTVPSWLVFLHPPRPGKRATCGASEEGLECYGVVESVDMRSVVMLVTDN